ncbi:MAG: HEAT repeat domain-containing protein [Bacteroidetes bacterium]|nr:HEAT repeat domain-containing protein [Bacteroidota bacterium]
MKSTRVLITLLLLLLRLDHVLSQTIQVGIIDYYGPRPANAIFDDCLPFKVNDTISFLTDSISYVNARREILECILEEQSIKQADITFICCDAIEGKWMAFIGTSDEPKTHNNENSKTMDLRLPVELTKSYDSLSNLLLDGIQSGESSEDDSEGHALFSYPPCRKIQRRFIVYAANYLETLRNVIKSSMHSRERAAAATIIAYYHDKRDIVNDLLTAVKDEDEGVRNDAIRALGIILKYAQERPNLKISIQPDPFISLMNSISWTDRNKSVGILLTMSEQRDKTFLQQVKKEILKSIVDMAKWKSEGHALAGYIILGRIAGWTDIDIHESSKGDRSKMIDKMLTQIK